MILNNELCTTNSAYGGNGQKCKCLRIKLLEINAKANSTNSNVIGGNNEFLE